MQVFQKVKNTKEASSTLTPDSISLSKSSWKSLKSGFLNSLVGHLHNPTEVSHFGSGLLA